MTAMTAMTVRCRAPAGCPRRPPAEQRRGAGFTMLELLITLGIVVLALGAVASLPAQGRNDLQVRAAAEELAACLRQARSLAMDRRAIYCLTINIEDAPGSSGRLINNHSGGHWYQIVSPCADNYNMNYCGNSMAPFPQAWTVASLFTIGQWQNVLASCWYGPRHVLPAHQVRFLALSDEDDGATVNTTDGNAPDIHFPPTYPRPWFGTWDATSQRLLPWGGYDTTLLDASGRHCAGFFYEGRDGAISGCRDPATRTTTSGPSAGLYQQGRVRPLINGRFQDCCFLFLPDGSISEQLMPARNQSFQGAGAGGGIAPGDLGDRCGQSTAVASPMANLGGAWYLTLCPDAIGDSDQFASARDAYASITPAYRVMITAQGMVDVIRVANAMPAGAVPDTSISDWQDASQTTRFYPRDRLTDASGQAVGTPVEEFVTPALMAHGQWWLR